MDWNEETQVCFDKLRMKEIAGTLTEHEQAELAELFAMVEADEAIYLAPTIERMSHEQDTLRERLYRLQAENEALAKLLAQQEQLAADARRWLAQFEKRHRSILRTYMHLTGEVLTPLPS